MRIIIDIKTVKRKRERKKLENGNEDREFK